MLNKSEYEQIYCPSELEDIPKNYRRVKYLCEFGTQEIPIVSDADLYTNLSKIIPADKKLDNYTIGIYTRLQLLSYFKRPFDEIYQYGNKEYIDRALNKLKEEKYISFSSLDDLKIVKI